MAKAKESEQTPAAPLPLVGVHGAPRLPHVVVDDYNIELEDDDGGFLGDRCSKKALYALLDKWRKPLAKEGKGPFGDRESRDISKAELDEALANGDTDAAGVVHGVVEDYAQALAFVTRRMLKQKAWKDTERIVVGGGMREHKIGELAIGRAALLLKADEIAIDIVPIRNNPEDAGMIGAVQLAPSWVFDAHDHILAVDIGGSRIRAGIVALNRKKAADFAKAAVVKREVWRHLDDKPSRDEAVERLCAMLTKLIRAAEKESLPMAPFIGIGCPGHIEADGSIARGAQNLPGNWESARFHLPSEIHETIPTIGEHETQVVMHNDAVVQGLSEVPFMGDVEHWGVLTLGTGLGNARFTNRELPQPEGRN
jgi:predicted NBD/HSP70 family sugar kinase